MKTLLKLLCAIVCVCLAPPMAKAQTVGIKTNLLHDAAASPNLAVEFGIAPKWTMEIGADVNWWKVHKHEYKHWLATAEARYWLCEKFQGNFFALEVMGGQYRVGNIPHSFNFLNNRLKGLRNERWIGWGAGAGINYGHSWVLGEHWNLEAEIGIGWIYTRYDIYSIHGNKPKLRDNKVHNYVGPTKLALNLEYIF